MPGCPAELQTLVPPVSRKARVPLRAGLLCAALLWTAGQAGAAPAEGYVGRPIYSEPLTGLQLPPGCKVDPSWRAPITGSEFEIWIASCDEAPRVWLLRRQVIGVVNAQNSRLRFQVLDERIYADETAGETLSVQCSGQHDEPGYAVVGARWRPEDKELRLRSSKSALRADVQALRLAELDTKRIECVRFPEREAMMKRLQQHN